MRFGLHYTLQSPTGRWVESYTQCVRQIVAAESYGFTSVLIAEHHFKPDGVVPTPFVLCGAIAARTNTIRVGPGVLLLPLHHPIDVAEQTCMLDVVSNGRAILGVGLGNTPQEFAGFGLAMSDRAKRMEEGLVCVRDLLSQDGVSFSGEFYAFRDVSITPRPVQKPRPPIWVGAEKSKAAVRRAAIFGDAWLISPLIPPGLLSTYVSVYEDALRASGRYKTSLRRPMRKDVYIAKSVDQASAEAEPGIINQYYNSYLRWGALLDDEGRPLKYGETSKEELLEIIRRRIVVGGPDELIQAAELAESRYGVTDLIMRVQFPGLRHEKALRAIRLIGQHVIPHFRD